MKILSLALALLAAQAPAPAPTVAARPASPGMAAVPGRPNLLQTGVPAVPDAALAAGRAVARGPLGPPPRRLGRAATWCSSPPASARACSCTSSTGRSGREPRSPSAGSRCRRARFLPGDSDGGALPPGRRRLGELAGLPARPADRPDRAAHRRQEPARGARPLPRRPAARLRRHRPERQGHRRLRRRDGAPRRGARPLRGAEGTWQPRRLLPRREAAARPPLPLHRRLRPLPGRRGHRRTGARSRPPRARARWARPASPPTGSRSTSSPTGRATSTSSTGSTSPTRRRRPRPLTRNLRWNVEGLAVARDGSRVALTVNADGASRLYFLEPRSGKLASGELPQGVAGGLRFPAAKPGSLFLGLATPRSPGDVWQVTPGKKEPVRWTRSEMGGIDPATLVEPRAGPLPGQGRRLDPGLALPPARAEGKRPVVVSWHGGPGGAGAPDVPARSPSCSCRGASPCSFPTCAARTGTGRPSWPWTTG